MIGNAKREKEIHIKTKENTSSENQICFMVIGFIYAVMVIMN